MAIFIQTICLILFVGMISSWPALVLEPQLPMAFVHTSIEEGPESSLFGSMNQMIANMHKHFEHVFNWPRYPVNHFQSDYDFLPADYDDLDNGHLHMPEHLLTSESDLHIINSLTDIQSQLDAIQPVCTTITNTPTTISPRKSRRKKLPVTKTTTCIKELIVNGQRHFSEDITTVDDKGEMLETARNSGSAPLDAKQIQL